MAEQALADRTLLRLFQAALKAEKLGRALDLAALLTLPQSLEGALRLARHHRCSLEQIWRSPSCLRVMVGSRCRSGWWLLWLARSPAGLP